MKILKYLSFSVLFILTQAHAALNLELTQGMSRALPIAVISFSGQTNAEQDKKLSNIIKNDLIQSGRFRLVKGADTHQPHEVNSVNYAYWRSQKADNLVIGNITSQGSGQVKVNYQLLTTAGNTPIILSQKFTVNASQLRALAHHISDTIYQKLTGDKGIFSTRIAYILVNRYNNKPTQYQLEVADYDGYNAKALLTSSTPIMSPSWSPNGKQIAYVSFERRRAQIYTVNVQTGKRQLITSFKGINGAPAFSPDGRKLAVVLSKGGSPNIYIIDLAQRKLRQVTFGKSINTEPNWSPDGNQLVFTSDRGGSPQIYQFNLAANKTKRVTFTGPYNASAEYTPNGADLVLLHRQQGLFTVALQDLRSGQLLSLTQAGLEESPSVAPNGKMIVYATRFNGKGVLSMVSTDGKVRLRLPSRQGNVQEPAWSPFLS